MTSPTVTFRDEPRPTDAAAIREIVASTGFFHDFEIDVAVELIDERLARGIESGYHFVFAEGCYEPRAQARGEEPCARAQGSSQPRVLGYTCFGPIPCTIGSFDLYWIAVHDDCRGRGLGRALMEETERRLPADARRIYIETSSQAKYEPTRAFYERCGYRVEGRFEGFYAEGDDKLVFSKRIK